ncbi:putative O-methyltransferase [Lentithecium fluviatile CBS 122367]|uniref:Putative O-methyltransferase n=1 Tax=Lentithecium fluviatile CBS 122367 TaxID=1168545 RepID=A0A6G1IJ38_9PLEO|nr:putative O-methyltransferase [Lentithecium fluviatile CBS 122367]
MLAASYRIAELAAEIEKQTQRIDNYLTSKSFPHPSFDVGGPVDLSLPPDLKYSRAAVLRTTQELNDLLQGPENLIFNHQHNRLVHLKLISHFDLANKIPIHGEISFKNLAATVGVDRAALIRILHLGIVCHMFKEPRLGMIAHSTASRQIAEDPLAASWVGANVDEMWPAPAKTVDALVKWPQAEEPNQAATIPSGTVIDLGGSHGDAAFALARKYPSLRLIVQELPEVVTNSQEEEDLDVKFMVHDFFEEQLVKATDVYLYRWNLHNWPDKYCIKTLRALIPVLKRWQMDLTMLKIGNAKEQDLDELKLVFQDADPRFAFKGMMQSEGSKLAIIEFTWE